MNPISNQRVYMDNAATTALAPAVLEAMLPYLSDSYGNASSIHAEGRAAHEGLEQARRDVASVPGCRPQEIIFTSGGTESDNLALKGVAMHYRSEHERGGHIITTQIEHHAILHSAEYLTRFGFDVTYLPVDGAGLVDPVAVEQAIRPDTILVSVMLANNEIGTIEPIAEIARITKAHGIPFHTDAVQAGGVLRLKVDELGVDLLSLSAHKFYGPKGVGVLYVRSGTQLLYQQQGGAQEARRRAGTENVAGIVGLATALKLAEAKREREVSRLTALRDRLIAGLLEAVPDSTLNGHPTLRLPGNTNFCIAGIEAETLLLRLDLLGIAASSASACTSGAVEPSHVLKAIGVPDKLAVGSLRLSLGANNTDEDVDYLLKVLPGAVVKLRGLKLRATAVPRRSTSQNSARTLL